MTATIPRLQDLPDMPSTLPGAGQDGMPPCWKQSSGAFVYQAPAPAAHKASHAAGGSDALTDLAISIRRTDLGIVSETYPTELSQAGSATTGGLLYLFGLPLEAGKVVTNGLVVVTGAASGLTLAKYGIYQYTGSPVYTRVAATVDASGSFGTTGTKTIAFTSPYTPSVTGLYMFAFLFVGTTPPTLLRAANTGFIGFGLSGHFNRDSQGSQSDLPATSPGGAGGNIFFWAGVS